MCWRSSSRVVLLAVEEAPKWRGEVGQGRAQAMDEPFLEADVFLVSETAVRVERGWIVGADVEHDLVACPQQLRGHRAGDGGGETTSTIVDMGQDVADDRQPRPRDDHLGPRGSDQLAVDAQAVGDPVR